MRDAQQVSWWAWSVRLVPVPLAIVLWMWHKLRADRRERQRSKPGEWVMAVRQLQADGQFRRRWVRRTPDDLTSDRVYLECGHWKYYFPSEQLEPGKMIECHDCARQYLKDAQNGAKQLK